MAQKKAHRNYKVVILDELDSPRVFWLHYNKPNDKWSFHWRGKCHIVDEVVISVPVETRKRTSQPRAIIHGYAKSVVCTELPGGYLKVEVCR
mgnify:CR=1 FL=1